MRTSLSLLLLAVLKLVNGFTVLNPSRRQLQLQLNAPSTTRAYSSSADTDDYDDWYADFDPADYEDVGGGSRNNVFIGGHDYKRDTSADRSNVDEATVNNLIAERLQCRKAGRFGEADAIRDTLLNNHGVAIFDREKVWRSGCSTGGSGTKWRPGGGNRGTSRKPRDFGPNGHDYDLSRDAGPNTSSLDDKEIHSLLAQRLEYKMSRDFSSADAIQDELIQAGVYVHDGNKEWRADGQSFGDYRGQGGRPGRERGSRNDRNGPYTQSSQSLSTNDADAIQDLVDERMDAKKVRDYDVADGIRDELRQDYNVEVNDKLRQWSVGGDFGIPQANTKFSMSPASETPENADEIQQLVEERNEARRKRDFDTADAIREDLLDQNVMIDDKLRQWAVGGMFNNKRNAPSFDTPFAKRGGGGDLSEEQEALIAQLLEERSEAKRDKEFGKADRIRDRLESEFKVRIDDRAREWHIVSDKYAMNPVSEIEEDIRTLIEERLVERSVAKLERDYETADAIRDELAEVYGVDIDDRVREWRVIGAPMSNDDAVFEVDESDFEVDDDETYDEEEGDYDEDEDGFDDSEAVADDVLEAMESEDLASLTVPELKIRLKEAGLPVSGRKAELIERLSS